MEKKENAKQSPEKGKEQSEDKEREMSQQEFEELLMKVKFIAFGVMGNIKWDKVRPLEFRKNEESSESALLMFEIEEKGCWIEFEVSEESKQELLKMAAYKIVEDFIFQHLVNHGKNGYFDYKCPECKQTTLSKSLITNSPNHEEAICCNLCGWAMSMKVYLEYLNDKKNNSSLEFYEWLRERNRQQVKKNNYERNKRKEEELRKIMIFAQACLCSSSLLQWVYRKEFVDEEKVKKIWRFFNSPKSLDTYYIKNFGSGSMNYLTERRKEATDKQLEELMKLIQNIERFIKEELEAGTKFEGEFEKKFPIYIKSEEEKWEHYKIKKKIERGEL